MLTKIENAQYSALIDLSHGATCVSLKSLRHGFDVLRERDGDINVDNHYLYGMPHLFPVNRISNGRYTFEGREYVFPVNEPSTGCHLHGTLCTLPFSLKELSKSSLTAEFVSNSENRYLSFPHDFRIEVTYTISDSGLDTCFEIFNLSGYNMPVMLGHHTTFSTAFAQNEPYIFAEIGTEYERSMKNYLPTGSTPEYDHVSLSIKDGRYLIDGSTLSRHYRASGSSMGIISKERGLKVVYTSDEIYKYRLIYSNSRDYVCLEPQTCLVDAPNSTLPYDESGFHFIAPHKSQKYNTNISVCEVN